MRRIVSAFFVILCLASPVLAQDAPAGMLPEGVIPTLYRLDFGIDPTMERFTGAVEIDVTLDAAMDGLWLHARDLAMETVAVVLPDGSRIKARFEQEEGVNIGRVIPDRAIGPGDLTLSFVYSGELGASLDGLYRVTEGDAAYVYTHFQALSARSAFPGFDEPRFKTPFDISMVVRAEDVAVSNAPVRESVAMEAGRKRVVFERTEPLPTYLIALATGPFDVVEADPLPANAVRDRPVPLRGIAPKGEGKKLHYALEHTPAMMDILEDYFGVPYPYAKLDLVAVAEFSPGGMENAGAIFYRRDGILVGETPSIYTLRWLAKLHAHELAHSWFGNLVTPVWWDDLWLNEAFATWMAAKVTHSWRPETHDNREMARSGRSAMWNDRFVSARQIRQPVETDDDVSSAFDSITYSKGGAVLGMVERYMGEEAFREGVRRFINSNANGVATADDFFGAMASAAGDEALIGVMRSFVEQPGIPLIEAEWECRADGGATVTLAQSRALPLGSKGDPVQEWTLPLCLAYEDGGERGRECVLMHEREMSVALDTRACPAWVMPNADGAAYGLFSLSEKGWSGLLAHLGMLKPAEASAAMHSLVSDYDGGKAMTGQVLTMARALARASEWDVVQAPIQGLRNIKNFALPREKRGPFQKVMQDIYRPALDRFDLSDAGLAADETDENLALLRNEVLWFVAHDALDPELRARFNRLGRAWLGYGGDGEIHREILHPNLVRPVLSVVAGEGGLSMVETLFDLLETTDDAALRADLIYALGFQTDPAIAIRVREYILDPDTPGWIASGLLRRQGRRVDNAPALLEFITGHYDALMERLPRRHRQWVVWRLSALCDAQSAERVQTFFSGREVSGRALANVLEQINICAATVAVQRPDALATLQ